MERNANSVGVGGFNTSKEELDESAFFDGFTNRHLEVGSIKGHQCKYRPVTHTDTVTKYIIYGDPDKFIDPESFRLKGKCKLQKKGTDGAWINLEAEDECSVINNAIQASMDKVNFTLDGTLFGDNTNNWYSWKSTIETLLSYSKSGQEFGLQNRCWFPDDAGKHDKLATAAIKTGLQGGPKARSASQNKGYEKRRKLFNNSEWVYFQIPLHSDICTMKCHIPPNVKVEVDITRGEKEFVILSPDTSTSFRLHFEDLELLCIKQEHSAEVRKFYFDQIKSGKRYKTKIDRSVIREYTKQTGAFNLSHYNLISGAQMPDQIIACMVEEAAVYGSKTKNPFNFQHFRTKESSIVYNGIHEPEDKLLMTLGTTDAGGNWSLTTDEFVRGDCNDFYQSFLDNIGLKMSDENININKEKYFQGYFFIPFDRSPDKCNRYHEHIYPGGVIDINHHVSVALEQNIRYIVYATYSTEIIFDSGKVFKDQRLEI